MKSKRVWISRQYNGNYSMDLLKPEWLPVRGAGFEDFYCQHGEPIGVRNLCPGGIKSLFGVELQVGEQIRIAIAGGEVAETSYEWLTLRNKGYISEEVQEKIRRTHVLIAGCGIGSTIAEALVRMGFEKLTLVDGDRVAAHNLNRQAFSSSDIGHSKVQALSRWLKEINPQAKVTAHDAMLTKHNVSMITRNCELIFDTIDFIDLPAITSLHDECDQMKVPIISAVSAGFGAAGVFFPPHREQGMFRSMFGLPPSGPVDDASYSKHFGPFLEALIERLDPAVVDAMAQALNQMEDGKPCPAPHVAAGAYTVAGLASTMAVRYLSGLPLAHAPKIILADLAGIASE